LTAFDEMHGIDGNGVREPYRSVHQWLEAQEIDDLVRKRGEAEALFRRTGITFAVYGDDAPPPSASSPSTSSRAS
jgi:uncharacterized circularly permuted ATP-grasp superfamily protein